MAIKAGSTYKIICLVVATLLCQWPFTGIMHWKNIAQNSVWEKKSCKDQQTVSLSRSLYTIKMTLQVKKSKGSVWFESATIDKWCMGVGA